jgi:hypothetical protein
LVPLDQLALEHKVPLEALELLEFKELLGHRELLVLLA